MHKKSKILAFFYTILFSTLITACMQPKFDPTLNYPEIIYEKEKNFSVMPEDFANTFINRFKILYAQNNNTNIKKVQFYFIDYAKDGDGFIPTGISRSIAPSYYLKLKVIVELSKDSKSFTQSYDIPIKTFNPPYSHDFDGLIKKILNL